MEYIQPENLLKSLHSLKSNEKVIIKISSESDEIKTLLYLSLKNNSYEILFRTVLCNNNDVKNEFDIKRFLQEYSENYSSMILLRNNFIDNLIGSDTYEFISQNKIRYIIDYYNGFVEFNLLPCVKQI